jgi:hypothetical protein
MNNVTKLEREQEALKVKLYTLLEEVKEGKIKPSK